MQETWQRQADEEAKRKAEREAELAAEALKRKEAAEHKKLLLEQQEADRLHQKRLQEKKELDAERMSKQVDTLISKLEADRHQRENVRLQEIQNIIQNREPTFHVLDWHTWLSNPENQRLAELDFEYAVQVFRRDNRMASLRKRTGGKKKTYNYVLSFTGDTNTQTRRADLVATDFNPNDPTNKGFAESSGRIPLAKSGFTISYWYRPDEHASDAFAMGWKYADGSRFSFGMRNAARPFFSVGNNSFGTYGGHNSWVTMLTNSGFSAENNIDDFLDGDSNLRLDQWYHIAITYVGSEPGGVSNNTTDRYRRIYFNGKQIYGQNSEAIGTDYNDWHNVDRTGLINWTANLDEELTRGFSFGMRCLKGSGNTDGVDNAKYNNGHACGLDDVAIYNELKDNDWVRSVYNDGTNFNHTVKGGSGLVGYWRFNEGNGTTVKDLGPYGYHGTLTNGSDAETVQASISSIASGVPTWEVLPSYSGD